MTLVDLIKLAKERETTLSSVALEYWDYLDAEEQRALGRELCATIEDDQDLALIDNLYEHETSQFVEHFIDEINKVLDNGEGGSVERKTMKELFNFIVMATCENDFDDRINENIDCYNEAGIYYSEEDDEQYQTITCDLLDTLEAVKKVLEDLYL